MTAYALLLAAAAIYVARQLWKADRQIGQVTANYAKSQTTTQPPGTPPEGNGTGRRLAGTTGKR